MGDQHRLAVGEAFLDWFRSQVADRGLLSATQKTLVLGWGFLRDSLPDRRRQRYGDIDYDWDRRVDTTAATVGWRDRLLGLFHSPYQPTEPQLFQEMMASVQVDYREFVFIDIGSGKGRVLLMAAEYPFRKIVGVELLSELHRVAEENIAEHKSETEQCSEIECIHSDATEFAFLPEPSIVYLFNPLPRAGLVQMLGKLRQSLKDAPRRVILIYHNPLLERVISDCGSFKRIGGTHQYSIFENHMPHL